WTRRGRRRGGAGARGRCCRPSASGRRWCSASPTSSPWTSPPTPSPPPAPPPPCSTASARSPTSPRAATLSTSTSERSPRTGFPPCAPPPQPAAPGCSTPSPSPPPASGWRPASSSSRSAPPSSGGTRPRSSPSPPAQTAPPPPSSSHDSGEALQASKALARSSGAVVAVSGAVDFITDGEQVVSASNGVALMQKITATGCAVTALIAAFVGADPSDALAATACALAIFGLAGEIGMESAKGPASLRMHLIDALYGLDE
ncbi:hypothetical protein CFC21_004545, partial [Triticum aestivum]